MSKDNTKMKEIKTDGLVKKVIEAEPYLVSVYNKEKGEYEIAENKTPTLPDSTLAEIFGLEFQDPQGIYIFKETFFKARKTLNKILKDYCTGLILESDFADFGFGQKTYAFLELVKTEKFDLVERKIIHRASIGYQINEFDPVLKNLAREITSAYKRIQEQVKKPQSL